MRRRSKTISNTKFRCRWVNLSAILFSICIGFSSCYVATEACLDSNATNFDVYADENCCCTYPTLNVNIVKVIEGDTLSSSTILTDTFTNTLGQKYQIVEQSFYISDMVLTYDDGSRSQVLDTLERPIPQDSDTDVVIEDNFGLVRQSSAAYSVGDIRENGGIIRVNFRVGLTDQINMLVPSQLPSSHALGTNNEDDHYIEDDGYVYIRWVINPIDVVGVDEITVTLSGASAAQDISLGASFGTAPGLSTELPLIVDYGKWLEGIDFAADQSIIDAKIIENTPSAFSLL